MAQPRTKFSSNECWTLLLQEKSFIDQHDVYKHSKMIVPASPQVTNQMKGFFQVKTVCFTISNRHDNTTCTYIHQIIDVSDCVEALNGDPDERLTQIMLKSNIYNKKLTYDLQKSHLRCLRQRTFYQSSGFLWLNDQVRYTAMKNYYTLKIV